MGGSDTVVSKARESFDAGDFRWVVTVLNHVVFADPGHQEARELQAQAFTQLGYGSENGTWRNFFLSGAVELRRGNFGTPAAASAPDIIAALSIEQAFDALAISVNGPRCWNDRRVVDWVIDGEHFRVVQSHGVLTHQVVSEHDDSVPEQTLTTDRASFIQAIVDPASLGELIGAGRVESSGDSSVWVALLGTLDRPDPAFNIVEP